MRRNHWIALAGSAGGALILLGAVLPWLSLDLGLHPLRCIIGLNGKILAAGGAVCLIVAVMGWGRSRPAQGRALVFLGIGLAGFSTYLVFQQWSVFRELRANPMFLAKPGYGLFVALGGALL